MQLLTSIWRTSVCALTNIYKVLQWVWPSSCIWHSEGRQITHSSMQWATFYISHKTASTHSLMQVWDSGTLGTKLLNSLLPLVLLPVLVPSTSSLLGKQSWAPCQACVSGCLKLRGPGPPGVLLWEKCAAFTGSSCDVVSAPALLSHQA